MSTTRQNADGSESIIRERDYAEMNRAGAYAGAAGTALPAFPQVCTMEFNVAGGTDTGGGILSWLNNLGYDIVVTGHRLVVTTVATGACSVEAGQTTTATGTSTNFISSQDVHSATGLFNGGVLSVKVASLQYITISTVSGASAGLVAKAFVDFHKLGAAGAA